VFATLSSLCIARCTSSPVLTSGAQIQHARDGGETEYQMQEPPPQAVRIDRVEASAVPGFTRENVRAIRTVGIPAARPSVHDRNVSRQVMRSAGRKNEQAQPPIQPQVSLRFKARQRVKQASLRFCLNGSGPIESPDEQA